MTKKLAKILQVPDFASDHIGLTCLNQNVTDWNIRHKIYISQLTILLDSMQEFNSSQIFLHAACSWLSLQQLEIYRP